MKRVIISVINDLSHDQRLHRLSAFFEKEGYDVFLVGRRLTRSVDLPESFPRNRRFRMVFRSGPFFYGCFAFRLFFFLLFRKKAALYVAIDLDTLGANYLNARLRRGVLLYDSHEYFTQVPELLDRKWVQRIWEFQERKLVPKLPMAITVSGSIARVYSDKYGIPFHTVRNTPNFREPVQEDSLRIPRLAKLHLNESNPILLYQGALNVGRGIELMIDTMPLLEGFELIIAGTGDIEGPLKARAAHSPAADQIHFLGRLVPDDLKRVTAAAHVGLSLEEDLGLSYRYALPNKLFDYIQARIPVICSDLEEMRVLVLEYGIGDVLKERTPKILKEAILRVTDPKNNEVLKKSLNTAAGELCWEKEQEKLVPVVQKLMSEFTEP